MAQTENNTVPLFKDLEILRRRLKQISNELDLLVVSQLPEQNGNLSTEGVLEDSLIDSLSDSTSANTSDLLQQINELQKANCELRNRLDNERQAVVTVNQRNEELQKELQGLRRTVEKNTNVMEGLIALKTGDKEGSLLMHEAFDGYVLDVSDDEVLVRYHTADDLIEQVYARDQFEFEKLPEVGDHVKVHVYVTRVSREKSETQESAKESIDGSPKDFQNIINGDYRF
jgi:hypothetical protein